MSPPFRLICAYRPDGGRRDQLKAFTDRWWRDQLGQPEGLITVGSSDDGPFNRSQALNRAAEGALIVHGDTAVLVAIDADVIARPAAVHALVERAHQTGRAAVLERYFGLTRLATDQVIAGELDPWSLTRGGSQPSVMVERFMNDHVSSIVAVPVALWRLTGGFDERMVGWGYEDSAFAHTCQVIAGPVKRVPGDVVHLWHPPSPERKAAIRRDGPNRLLRDRYLQATTPGELAAILERPEQLLRTFIMPIDMAPPPRPRVEVEPLPPEHVHMLPLGDIGPKTFNADVTPPRVAILVPYRADGGERDRLWAHALDRWKSFHPDWPVHLGASPPGPFNRSAAINDAARQAAAADPTVSVFVIIDADVLADPRAVRRAVDLASAGRGLIVSHNERLMLNQQGTAAVLDGYEGSWRDPKLLDRTAPGSHGGIYRDSVSCCVAVSRATFDLVGGFDELFVGWGYEDTAFQIAVEAMTDSPVSWLESQLFHLWHQKQPTAKRGTPTFVANGKRVQRYRDARWDPDAVTRLLVEHRAARRTAREGPPVGVLATPTIPRVIHRTLPAGATDQQIERWWQTVREHHDDDWQLRTWQDPFDALDLLPRIAHMQGNVKGAQWAGLVRLAVLERHGGIYVDSDVECFRSLEPFTGLQAFIGWQDEHVAPDAVIGARPGHPAISAALDLAIARCEAGEDPHRSGPDVTTECLTGRDDVMMFPPGTLFQVHYQEVRRLSDPPKPWEYLRHHWHGSWLTPEQKATNARNQR